VFYSGKRGVIKVQELMLRSNIELDLYTEDEIRSGITGYLKSFSSFQAVQCFFMSSLMFKRVRLKMGDQDWL
jgi:hypothetical protein